MLGNLQDPWLSFLRDPDQALESPVEIHCLGGFVLSAVWGLPRATGDIDVVEVAPTEATATILGIAGAGSAISTKYKLHIHRVGVAEYPEGYASRLMNITPPGFKHLHLMVFDPCDLALAKLSRNSPRDREDVRFLAEKGLLQGPLMKARFNAELLPNLLRPEVGTLTLDLWIEELFA